MSDINLNQVQTSSQLQTMKMTPQQIMTFNLLSMGALDLRGEIYKNVEENPALEIVKDRFSDGTINTRKTTSPHIGKVSAAGNLQADAFQQLIENAPDTRFTLQQHLIHQLNMTRLSEIEEKLCLKLIQNLDEKGFHILAPEGLLDFPQIEGMHQTAKNNLLAKCLSTIQAFDPSGICCTNLEESLEIQAKQKDNIPKLTLFLIKGHLDFLVPPQTEKIAKKIYGYIEENKKKSFGRKNDNDLEIIKSQVSPKNIEDAVKFIQSLEPFPARNFAVSDSPQYIKPDVNIERCTGILDKEDLENGLILDTGNHYFKVNFENSLLPEIKISSEFSGDTNFSNTSKKDKDFYKKQTSAATAFIDGLEFRKKTIIRSSAMIVSIQKEFFQKGPGHLKPLSQKEFAKLINLHVSNVSRMADSKFIRCTWGTFPIKYFFSSAVQQNNKTKDNTGQKSISSDAIKHKMIEIIESYKEKGKNLSDRELTELLEKHKIHVARRTVAKYRKQLNIESSYNR